MSKITEMVASVNAHKGFAKSNRYKIEIEGSDRDINLFCESVNLPGRAIFTQEYANGRNVRKMPYSFADSEVRMTFHLSEDFFIKKFFDEWMGKVINVDRYSAGYKSDYAKVVKIYQLDSEDYPIYGVELLKAFPLNMADIALSNNMENTVTRLEVSFTYDNFVVLDIPPKPKKEEKKEEKPKYDWKKIGRTALAAYQILKK